MSEGKIGPSSKRSDATLGRLSGGFGRRSRGSGGRCQRCGRKGKLFKSQVDGVVGLRCCSKCLLDRQELVAAIDRGLKKRVSLVCDEFVKGGWLL
jgi:hypothetical protein